MQVPDLSATQILSEISEVKTPFSTSDLAPPPGSGASFEDFLKQAISEAEQANQNAQLSGLGMAVGNLDNITQAQIDTLKAETAVQLAVQVTTRAVNAYKEIMQMQV